MAASNPFSEFTAAELTELRAAYKQAIIDIATTGQSYSINGRSFTAADLDKLKETIKQINLAIGEINGTRQSFAVAITSS